ncbi:MAG: tyrosine-protein phosphatase [Lautropia sp.]
MIDLHCHFLPGVDDGARTVQEGLTLAAVAAESGITTAVLTPHVYPGVYDNTLSTLLPRFVQFRADLEQAGIGLAVHLGGEVRLHPDVLDLMEAGELPSIGSLDGMQVILIELPDGEIPRGALTACRHFADRGYRWLIAHPERNKAVMRDPASILPFCEAGALLQLTAASIIGKFGLPALHTARYLLDHGLVSVIATDAHNLAFRPPRLREAFEAIAEHYGHDTAQRLMVSNPGEIIASRTA